MNQLDARQAKGAPHLCPRAALRVTIFGQLRRTCQLQSRKLRSCRRFKSLQHHPRTASMGEKVDVRHADRCSTAALQLQRNRTQDSTPAPPPCKGGQKQLQAEEGAEHGVGAGQAGVGGALSATQIVNRQPSGGDTALGMAGARGESQKRLRKRAGYCCFTCSPSSCDSSTLRRKSHRMATAITRRTCGTPTKLFVAWIYSEEMFGRDAGDNLRRGYHMVITKLLSVSLQSLQPAVLARVLPFRRLEG